MKKKKNLLFFTFISLSCIFLSAQDKPVVWESTNRADEVNGTVIIGGETVNVTAVVTANEGTGLDYSDGENNKIIIDVEKEKGTKPDSYKKNLDVNTDREYLYLSAGATNTPNIITFIFDKDVVITELGMADVTRTTRYFSDAYVLEGYPFDFVDFNMDKKKFGNVTPNSLTFNKKYTSKKNGEGRKTNWVRHYGHNILPKGSPLVVKYTGEAKGRGKGGVSNVYTAIAIKVSEDICYGSKAKGTAAPTLVGVSTLKRNTEEWLPQNLGAYLNIESKDKGFIITRIADPTQIQSPENGMIVWDTTDKCIKLYSDKGNTGSANWHCIKQGCDKEITKIQNQQ